MATPYYVTITQANILKALSERGELSPPEIAVHAQLVPSQMGPALNGLEHMGLVQFRTELSGERLVRLTGEGFMVARALARYGGTPPVGIPVPLASGSLFSGWLTPSPLAGSSAPHVLVSQDNGKE